MMKTRNKTKRPTIAQLWQDVLKHKKLYAVVLGATFLIVALFTLGVPNYYRCEVKLAPELSGSNRSRSGLASLASNFGINLGSNNNGVDAIFPTLYPDLMNSVAFKASLFPVKVQRKDDDTPMTYYDYLKHHQRSPWWSSAIKAVFSIFSKEESKGESEVDVDPFRLTKEQSGVIGLMKSKVVCDVDKNTMVITINVTDQDPLIAATMADSVQERLQDFITDYRTRKARVDLAYSQKLYKEAEERYEKARRSSAASNDANRRVFLDRVRSEQVKLNNEMNLKYQAYSLVAEQLRLAEAKVQEETPAFTLLQPATVPVRKAGPARARTCLIFLFLAFLATTAWVFHKEHHLIPLLFFDNEEEGYDTDDLLKALIKLSTDNQDLPKTTQSEK